MSNPLPADGQPIPEGLVAAVDETVVELQAAPAFDYDWRTKAEPLLVVHGRAGWRHP